MSFACGDKRPLPDEPMETILTLGESGAKKQEPTETAVSTCLSPRSKAIQSLLHEIKDYTGPQPKKKQSRASPEWTEEEDEALGIAVKLHGTENWKSVQKSLNQVATNRRTEAQCLRRYQLIHNQAPTTGKEPWTKQEDDKIRELVAKYGAKKWSFIAASLNGRKAKQTRERWHNHLRPDICKGEWTEQEDRIVLEFHQKNGNKWSEMTKILPGRTDNAIKNHWNASMRRKIRQYLAAKVGVSVDDFAKRDNGRYDFGGDLEGVLAAVRMPKEKKTRQPKEKKVRQPKEKKISPPKEKKFKASKTALKVLPGDAGGTIKKTDAEVLKKKRARIVKKKKVPASKFASPQKQLKMAFARKDRAAMLWSPRVPSSPSDEAGASLLLALSSSTESISPLKSQQSESTLATNVQSREDMNETADSRPQIEASLGFQDSLVTTVESMREGVTC